MSKTHYADPNLAQYYDYSSVGDDQGRARQDHIFCLGLAKNVKTVLDLGCGTGKLAIQMAKYAHVVGVDPAGAMLDIARSRDEAKQVEWRLDDARSVRLDQKFDLIVMTGHSFQVFLTVEDQLLVLQTIARHLNKNGKFIFDTRNPAYPGSKERTREQTEREFHHPTLGRTLFWNVSRYDEENQILIYKNGFQDLSTGKEHIGHAQIKYTSKNALALLLKQAGLGVDSWFGEWDGSPFQPHSKEIIPFGRLKN